MISENPRQLQVCALTNLSYSTPRTPQNICMYTHIPRSPHVRCRSCPAPMALTQDCKQTSDFLGQTPPVPAHTARSVIFPAPMSVCISLQASTSQPESSTSLMHVCPCHHPDFLFVCLWPPYLPSNSPHPGEALSHLFSNAQLLLRRVFLFFLRFLLRFISCF